MDLTRRTQTHQMLASGTRTTGSGTTNSFGFASEYIEGIIFVGVSAVVGGGTLTPTIQTSPDGANWYNLEGGSFLPISSASNISNSITNFGRYIRVSYTITGTSVTFSINFVGKT